MPVVPRISEDRIKTEPLPTVRRTVSATEETFGGGPAAARTAAATQDVIQRGLSIVESEFHKANELKALEASQKLSAEENRLLYDPTNGAFNKKGKDAFGLPDQVLGEYDKSVGAIEKELTNNEQRVAFKRQSIAHRVSIDNQVQRHVAAQIQDYDAETTKIGRASCRERV